jgi:hypothetical protein
MQGGQSFKRDVWIARISSVVKTFRRVRLGYPIEKRNTRGEKENKEIKYTKEKKGIMHIFLFLPLAKV